MIIWFAMGIPLLTALVLLILYQRRTMWWEVLIPCALSLMLIMIFKFTIELAQTSDTEYWGGWVVEARYYEDWDEEICWPEYDEDGNYVGEDCTTNYYPEYWEAINSNGETISISESFYHKLVKLFGNKKFVDMHRDYDMNDGDMYKTIWNRLDESIIPTTTVHHYENRIQVSSSVYRFPDVDPEMVKQYGLYKYPNSDNPFSVPCILGSGVPNIAEASKKLNFLNATLGARKQVRFWVLIFRDQPLEAGLTQEWYWQGGNKNEFILTIGVDQSNSVDWVYPISWTEAEELKVEARTYIDTMTTLDLNQVVDWLSSNVEEKWVRKQFADFSYLSVEPPLWSIIVTYVVTLFANLILSLWIVGNQYNKESPNRSLYRRRY